MKMDALIVCFKLCFCLFVGTNQAIWCVQREGSVYPSNDAPIDGVLVAVVVRKFEEPDNVALFIPQDRVIIVIRQIAVEGDGFVVVGHDGGFIVGCTYFS